MTDLELLPGEVGTTVVISRRGDFNARLRDQCHLTVGSLEGRAKVMVSNVLRGKPEASTVAPANLILLVIWSRPVPVMVMVFPALREVGETLVTVGKIDDECILCLHFSRSLCQISEFEQRLLRAFAGIATQNGVTVVADESVFLTVCFLGEDDTVHRIQVIALMVIDVANVAREIAFPDLQRTYPS